MRVLVNLSAILATSFVLSGCIGSTGPVGVLPRDPVPPPPSIAGETARRSTAAPRTATTSQRRSLSVPGRAANP